MQNFSTSQWERKPSAERMRERETNQARKSECEEIAAICCTMAQFSGRPHGTETEHRCAHGGGSLTDETVTKPLQEDAS